MIEIRRNSHHMNGENVEVLEFWKSGNSDGLGAEMIVSLPIEDGEEVKIIEDAETNVVRTLNEGDRITP